MAACGRMRGRIVICGIVHISTLGYNKTCAAPITLSRLRSIYEESMRRSNAWMHNAHHTGALSSSVSLMESSADASPAPFGAAYPIVADASSAGSAAAGWKAGCAGAV